MPWRATPALILGVLLAACSATGGAALSPSFPSVGASPRPAALTVFAAASLKAALEEASTAYEAAKPGTSVTISTDSSSALEAQIEQGAPADVFLSADMANPQKLVDAGFASGDPTEFAGNKLTIIVPADNPARIESPIDLARRGVKVIAAGDEVPITKYATRLVRNLASTAGYPADFATKYAANVVSREDNVKAVVGKIELGEGDAGIVYATDTAASGKVATVDVPDGANVPVTYAGVVVRASQQQAAARAFLDWLSGDGGRAILARYGFLRPAP